MVEIARVSLAAEPDFRLGRLAVSPGLRQISDGSGRSEVIEPRVMQVLVALAKAATAILSRDDLTRLCWDGRIVGEDAINRVISRLRRLSAGIGAGSFRIETITKVGFRLIASEPPASSPNETAVAAAPEPSRRRVMALGLSAAGVAVAGGLAWRARPRESERPSVYADAATVALLTRDTPSIAQAIGLLRRATALDPGQAKSWGLLAIAYAYAAERGRPSPEDEARRSAQAAADQAMSLQPGQPEAVYAEQYLRPDRGNWLSKERRYRDAIEAHPHAPFLRLGYGQTLAAVGRMRAAAEQVGQAVRDAPPGPGPYLRHALLLWASGRLGDADRVSEKGLDLFPLNYMMWFTRFNILMYSGRADQAVRLADDIEHRPPTIDEQTISNPMAAARALSVKSRPAIELAAARLKAAVPHGAGDAEDALLFTAATGNEDDAFAIAEGYFFGRGINVPDSPYPNSNAPRIATLARRETRLLFLPPTQPMRRDQRFAKLVADLGLGQYWAASGEAPDYLAKT